MPSKLEAWAKPTWWFAYAAVLPIVIAAVTLVVLYVYRRDGVEPCDAKLEAALFDALDLRPGMSVGQFEPAGPYVLSSLRARVRTQGKVYSLRPKTDAPAELLDVVFLPALGGAGRIEPALSGATRYLKRSGKLALTGPRQPAGLWLSREEAKSVASRAGFRLTAEKTLEAPAYVLIFEPGEARPLVDSR